MKSKMLILLMSITMNLSAPVQEYITLGLPLPLKGGYNQFVQDMALKEAGGNWKIINRSGHMGLFQFASGTLKHLGYKNITPAKFKRNPDCFLPEIQYLAFKDLTRYNEIELQSCMGFIGDTIKGVVITKSGLLAGAHLGGSGAVKLFIATSGRVDREDMNGTKISDYLRLFSIYEF